MGQKWLPGTNLGAKIGYPGTKLGAKIGYPEQTWEQKLITQKVSEKLIKSVWKVSGQCPDSFHALSGWCRTISELCLDHVKTVSWT